MNPLRKEGKRIAHNWYEVEGEGLFHHHPTEGERLCESTQVYGGPVIAICDGCKDELTESQLAMSDLFIVHSGNLEMKSITG